MGLIFCPLTFSLTSKPAYIAKYCSGKTDLTMFTPPRFIATVT